MKYILELEDEPNKDYFGEGNYYRCKQIPYWSISESMRNRLEPYDEAVRKTENSSEKPNNCEELNAYRECIKSRSFWDSKHCDGCYFDERCPFDEPKDEPTISKMEQVDEPQTERSFE